jgi:hypothetical protein
MWRMFADKYEVKAAIRVNPLHPRYPRSIRFIPKLTSELSA